MPPSVPDLRTIEIEGAPWFVAADVCRCLGLNIAKGGANASHHTRYLGADEKRILRRGRGVIGSPLFAHPRCTSHALVSESGLYKLIMRSDKATARPFQDWVTGGLVRGTDPPSSLTTPAVLVRFSDGAP